uniref:Uncharacterized protein n=1 Tax=Knipowitschia caucasica TaxID=637954 RepID=A0AAV2IT42_KNICA
MDIIPGRAWKSSFFGRLMKRGTRFNHLLCEHHHRCHIGTGAAAERRRAVESRAEREGASARDALGLNLDSRLQEVKK